MAEDWRLSKMELWVGTLAGGAIVILLGFLVIQGKNMKLLSDNPEFKLSMPRAYNLRAGAPIKLKDITIGTVSKVEMDSTTQIIASLEITRKYSQFIRKDSLARIKTTVIGEAFIEIEPGTSSSSRLQPGDTMKFEEYKDTIGEITEQVKKLTDSLTNKEHTIGQMLYDQGEIYKRIAATLENIEKSTEEFNKTISSVNSDSGTIGALLKDRTMYNNIVDVQNESKNLIKQMKQVLEQLNQVLNNLGIVTAQLPDLMLTGKETAASAKESIDAVKRIWPISSAISKPKQDEQLIIIPR